MRLILRRPCFGHLRLNIELTFVMFLHECPVGLAAGYLTCFALQEGMQYEEERSAQIWNEYPFPLAGGIVLKKINEVYNSNCLSHDRLLPGIYIMDGKEYRDIPYGVEYLENGQAEIRIFAVNACKVELETGGGRYLLEKKESGIWSTIIWPEKGYQDIRVLIDGSDVIYPMLPIGFGAYKACNFLDIPMKKCDYEIRNVKHGIVCTEYLYSHITEKHERIMVYLPPEYFEKPEVRYPVLYLQHGLGGNETNWVYEGKLNFIYDNLIDEGRAEAAICVMCGGMVQTGKSGDQKSDYRLLEELLLQDVIPHIDAVYRTIADREYRALAGLSMGSIQASCITFRHQDVFAWAGLFCGFLRDIISGDNSHLDEQYTGTYHQNMRLLFRAMGEEDYYFQEFLKDDKICKEKDLVCVRRTYHGVHNWQAFRTALLDFLPLVFRHWLF